MRQINKIYIHAAATPTGMDIGADEIRQWHLDKGWADIGYHYVIRIGGLVETGRDLDQDGDIDEEVGAHVYGHNKDTLGICLVGGRDQFDFSLNQLSAMVCLVATLCKRYDLTFDDVYGHQDADPGKACPRFDVKRFFTDLNPGDFTHAV